MSIASKPMSADELFEMPHQGMHYELVQGELRQMSPAGFEHGDITIELSWRLAKFVRDNRLGRCCGAETGFLISKDPDTVRAPDFAFVSKGRLPAGDLPKTFFPGSPDLAVEVMSPSDRTDEIDEKVLAWLAAGCRAVWTVDPRMKTVTIYHSPTDIRICTADSELADDTVVPGFHCRVADLFATA